MNWINIEDKLPDENQLVLVKFEYTIPHIPSVEQDVITGWMTTDHEGDQVWAFGNDKLVWDYEYNVGNPTPVEWMPLPDNR